MVSKELRTDFAEINFDFSSISLVEKKRLRRMPYTAQEVEQLLGKPEVTLVDFISEPRLQTKRTTLDLPTSERLYKGPWHPQREENTCTTWAITNAATASDISVPVSAVTRLLNHTMGVDGRRNEGLDFEDAATIIDAQPAGVRLEMVEDTAPKQYSNHWERMVTDEVIIEAAKLVKETIDNKEALVTVIPGRQSSLSFALQGARHAVSIAGYRVNDSGFMDVEIIDSVQGPSLTTIEDLTHKIVRAKGSFMKVKNLSKG